VFQYLGITLCRRASPKECSQRPTYPAKIMRLGAADRGREGKGTCDLGSVGRDSEQGLWGADGVP
jgi:hypothetical protein